MNTMYEYVAKLIENCVLYDTYMIIFFVENIYNFTDHICAAIIFVAHQTFAKIGFDRVFYLSGPVEFP